MLITAVNLLFCSSVSEFKDALCDFTEYTTCCNRGTFLFTEFDCSVFGSLVLLYGLCFNIKLQYIVRLGPAVKNAWLYASDASVCFYSDRVKHLWMH